MTALASYIAGDIDAAQYGIYDTDGFLCGAAGVLANGEDSGLARWRGLQNVDMTVPTRQVDPQTGDGVLQGTLTYEAVENMTLALRFGVASQADEAAVQGILVKSTPFHDLIVIDGQIAQLPLATLWVTTPAKKRVFGQQATKGYETHVFNQGEISQTGPDGIAERTLRNYQYFMSLDRPYVWPWGEAMATGSEGVLAGSAGRMSDTLGIPTAHCFRGDGIITTVTLDYTPIGTHETAGAFEVWHYDDSAGTWAELAATTGFTVAGSVVTFVTSIDAGDHVVIKYKTLEIQ